MSEISADVAKGEVRLSFNSGFYGRGAIEQAGKDFSESCEVEVDDERDGRIGVVLRPKAAGLEPGVLADEFCNYVLGLIQNAIF